MDIQLNNCQVKSLKFEESKEAMELTMANGVGYQEEESKAFTIYFKISLPAENNLLSIEYIATFTTSENVDDEFRESHFPSVNAPAIAYPYLRTFVSQFLLLSGYEPQILPTLNFVKMQEQDENVTTK
jgi:preprotein translocase subunit SecB